MICRPSGPSPTFGYNSLTQKRRDVRKIVARLFATHAAGLMSKGVLDHKGIDDITMSLRRVERYWTEQIRYIY